MVMPSVTRYARSGDVHIAYQIIGEGPLDLVFVMGWVSNIDAFWTHPACAGFLRRLASFSRLIVFDKRGTGLSDRVTELPTLEQRMDDVRAVMDAAGVERAALFGISEGAAMCILFAATYPERTAALAIYGGYARRLWAPDYPWGPTPAERNAFFKAIEDGWGGVVDLESLAPSTIGDEAFRNWWSSYLQLSASPGAALALAKMNSEIDVRPALSAIQVPTLIMHRTGDLDIDVGGARYLAEQIPGARYVELAGNDHLVFAGNQEEILGEVELFLTGTLPVPDPDRVLATVLITGIVGAAATAVRLGDRAWATVATAFEALVAEQVTRFRGRLAGPTFGGALATFDGPGRAIRCGCAIVTAAQGLGLTARAGLHTGECDLAGDAVRGAAVQIAERVYNQAGPGEVVVSHTVKDLVVGAGIAFAEGEQRLLTGPATGWRLFRVVDQASPASSGLPAPMAEEAGRSPAVLTAREREIVGWIARGYANRQIADGLSISPATVERHVANILAKLGFSSRTQVATWAVGHGLLDPAPV